MSPYRFFFVFFFLKTPAVSAAKFVYTGLNRWVHFLRTRGFSPPNCPAEFLWYWNCHGEVLLGTQIWPRRLLQMSQHSVFLCHNSADSHRREGAPELTALSLHSKIHQEAIVHVQFHVQLAGECFLRPMHRQRKRPVRHLRQRQTPPLLRLGRLWATNQEGCHVCANHRTFDPVSASISQQWKH